MKLLLSMRHAGALRNFASTVGELAARGHELHVVFMRRGKRGDEAALPEITREHPSISFEHAEDTAPWPWAYAAHDVRAAADYLRYLAPQFRDAHALRARAESRLPARWRATLTGPAVRTPAGAATVAAMLRTIEQALPASPTVMKRVARYAPDAVLVTPLVDLGSDQVEYIKAARALGIRCGLCVHSWDNLTNKGLIHVAPDRVYVWNEAQKREAVEMHGIAASDVVVTGAPVYDQWFAREPSTTRAEFCATVGLPANKPFFLYLCSSQFIAPHEDAFIRRWIGALRGATDARVREAGILVRPHPRTHPKHVERFTFSEFPAVVVWPPSGANPVDAASKNGYFDSLYHAAAAVGVNTSAQIEAGIVGRPVYSIRVPEYVDTQEGTLHFHYLLNEGGGLLRIADTLETHADALASALDGGEADERRVRGFVQHFVRPFGLDVPATPLLADGIETLARMRKPAPRPCPPWLYPVRLALRVRTARPAAAGRVAR